MKSFCLIEFKDSDEPEIEAILIHADTDQIAERIKDFISKAIDESQQST